MAEVFAGVWKLIESVNFDDYMKALGTVRRAEIWGGGENKG